MAGLRCLKPLVVLLLTVDQVKLQLNNSVPNVAAIVIGRNEGERLKRCINSIIGQVSHIVYVDSASSDCSVKNAYNLGALVIKLSQHNVFCAAVARNEGYRYVQKNLTQVDYIQFVDGDCEIDSGWVQLALNYLTQSPQYAIACGRRAEIDIDRSRYNRFCDIEWDTPIGDAIACGGDVLIRRTAFEQVAGYCEDLVAGEEPEMCVRLRKLGWKISRLDAPMTYHDADITRFHQWWRRTARAGHAFFAVWYIHRNTAHSIWKRETCSAVFWTLLLPVALVAMFANSLFGVLILLYPIQLMRMWRRAMCSGDSRKQFDWVLYLMLGKFAEGYGIANCVVQRLLGHTPKIYEYK